MRRVAQLALGRLDKPVAVGAAQRVRVEPAQPLLGEFTLGHRRVDDGHAGARHRRVDRLVLGRKGDSGARVDAAQAERGEPVFPDRQAPGPAEHMQQRRARQRRRHTGLPELGARHRDMQLLAQQPAVPLVPRRIQVHHQAVVLLGLAQRGHAAGGDRQVDIGVASVKAAQARRQPARGEGLRHIDRDALARAEVADLLDRILNRGESAVQALGQNAARRRQQQPLVVAHKHRLAEPVLQPLDLPAHRALRHMQHLAGTGKTAAAHRRVEGAQGMQGWQTLHGTGL